MALEKFKATFNLPEEAKMFFPYLFNTSDNLLAEPMTTLPPKSDYFYNSMSLDKRKKFDTWHAEHLYDGFNLKEQLALYCVADVKLLSAGLVDYRQMLLDETGIEALRDCTTLASTAMTHFRKNIMQANTIGIASELSYERHDRQSSIGLKFLKWIAKERNVELSVN